MRLLAIAVAAILAAASAEAACPPYHPACVTFGPNGFVRGTDRFGPYYGARSGSFYDGTRRNLYVERTAPPEAARTAPQMRFDPYGRVIVDPAPRRTIPGAEAYPPDDAGVGTLPEGTTSPDATARLEATARPGAAAPIVPGTPQGPADAPMQPSNGYYNGPRSQGRY